MKRIVPQLIDHMELEDFLTLEFNRYLYKDFNEGLKPYFKANSLSFFKSIYKDLAYFYPNYNKTPYEVNEYFDNKYTKEGRSLNFLIKREITFDIVRMVTTLFVYNKIDKYIPAFSDDFISGENLPFLYQSYFRLHEPVEDFWHIEELVDAKCTYRAERKFHNDRQQVELLKAFICSLELNDSSLQVDQKSTKKHKNHLNQNIIPKSSNFPENLAKVDANSRNKEVISLKWNSADHSELNHIHKELKENGYLNCDLRSFKRLFLGNVDFDKITWLKTDSSLIYFYGKLIETNKIQSPSNKWVKFKQIFEYSGSSASSLYSQYNNEIKNLPDKSFLDSLFK